MHLPRPWLWKLAVVGLASCLVLGGFAFWGSARLQSRAHAELVSVLSEVSGARASVRDVTLDLRRGVLVARGVEITQGARVLLRAEVLRGHMARAAALSGRLQVTSLELTSVRATLQAADLRRLGAELKRSPVLQALQLPAADVSLDFGSAGTLRVARANLALARTGDQRRLTLSRAPARWLRADRSVAQAQLTLTCALHDGSQRTTCEPTLEALQLGGRSFDQPVRSRVRVDVDRGTFEGELLGESARGLAFAYQPAPATAPPSATRELRIDASGLSLASLVAILANQPEASYDAVLDGSLTLRGDPQHSDTWRGELKLDAREVRVGTAAHRSAALAIRALRVLATLRLEGDQLVAEPLRFGLARGELSGRAQLGLGGEGVVELSAEQLDLADFESLAGVAVAGRGKLQLRAQSGPAAPELTASLALVDAAVGGVTLGQLTAALSLERGGTRLEILRAQATAPERRLSTTGARLEFDANGLAVAEAALAVERLPLAELYRSIGAGSDPRLAYLQARSAGTASLAYRRGQGAGRLELGLSLQLSAASLADYPFERGQLRARIALADARAGLATGVLELQQLSLSAGAGQLELAGKLDRGTLAMRLDTRGRHAVPLERWPWLRAHAPAFTGGLLVHAALGGTAERPRAELQLEVESLEYRAKPLGRMQLSARLGDRPEPSAQAAADGCRAGESAAAMLPGRAWRVCGEGLRGQLRMDVALGDSPDRPLRGQLELDRLALAPFLPPSASGQPTPGVLSARLELTAGNASQPDRVSGRVRVRELSLGEGDARLANTAPFELQVRAGQLELRDAILTGREQRFAISAAGTLGHEPRFIADGTTAAGVFTRGTEPLVKAFGDVALRLQWSPTQSPAVTGQADPRGLVVSVGALTFRNLRGAFVLAGERVQLTRVAAELGGGRIEVSGQLGLTGLRLASYDLALTAERVSLEPEPLVDVELDAENRLRWPGGAAIPELTGHVTIKRLLYRKQLHPETLAGFGTTRSGRPADDRLRLDLTIDHEQPIRVRNSLLDGELRCAGNERSLRVLGSDQRFGVIGQLAVTRGRVLFQGDEFRVQHGTIDFRDPKRIAPKFDLLAVAERPDTRVVLSANGTGDRFEVAVRCNARPPAVEPPPFNCHYQGDRVQCDDLDQLVAQFVCRQHQGAAGRQ